MPSLSRVWWCSIHSTSSCQHLHYSISGDFKDLGCTGQRAYNTKTGILCCANCETAQYCAKDLQIPTPPLVCLDRQHYCPRMTEQLCRKLEGFVSNNAFIFTVASCSYPEKSSRPCQRGLQPPDLLQLKLWWEECPLHSLHHSGHLRSLPGSNLLSLMFMHIHASPASNQ